MAWAEAEALFGLAQTQAEARPSRIARTGPRGLHAFGITEELLLSVVFSNDSTPRHPAACSLGAFQCNNRAVLVAWAQDFKPDEELPEVCRKVDALGLRCLGWELGDDLI